jgi:hypothetical protein
LSLVEMLLVLAGMLACCVGLFVVLPVIVLAQTIVYARLSGTAPPPYEQGFGGQGYGGYGPPGGAPPPGAGGPPGYGPPGGAPPGYGPPPGGGFGGPPGY